MTLRPAIISGNMFERLLAHRLRQNCISHPERIDAVDQVDFEFPHVHGVAANAVDQRGISFPFTVLAGRRRIRLPALGQVQRGDGVLANRLLIGFAEVRIALPDDHSHAHLGQLLGRGFFVEQTALGDRPILDESGDHLVDVFAANPRCFRALRRHEPLDLKMELARRLVEADIGSVGIIAAIRRNRNPPAARRSSA